MLEVGFEEGEDSFRRMHIQITSDMIPKWRNLRKLHIVPKQKNIRSNVNILSLYAMQCSVVLEVI